MLNIDYSTPRKFLMSLGLTLVILSFIIIFSLTLISIERLDKVMEISSQCQSLGQEMINQYTQALEHLIEIGYFVLTLSKGLIVLGSILFFIGLIIWRKNKWKD